VRGSGQKTAIILGAAGQDGSYLAELLVGKGYRVVGAEIDGAPLANLDPVRDRMAVVTAPTWDADSIAGLVGEHMPDEFYNLAAQSHVGTSWERISETLASGALLTAGVIEAVRKAGGHARVFQASSAAIFAKGPDGPKSEDSPIGPVDPYGVSKYASHRLVEICRERQGLFLCNGILYNHESPRRPVSFVTRKITNAAARIKLGKQDRLALGSLDSVRDWGYAPDYALGMWMMLQAGEPRDYVLATGIGHTVRDLLDSAFGHAGLDWKGYVDVDEAFVRPDEPMLVGDPARINAELGWKAETGFDDIVGIMLEADMELESS
jgi:GDPmannose 4,6-dehydratase